MTYEEARRTARAMLGSNAEVEEAPDALAFRFRVGVETGTPRRFVWVGVGNSWEEALDDAKARQLR